MIHEVAPQALRRGEPFSMTGRGFGIEGEEDQVTLSGVRLDVIYWSADRIECRAPRVYSGEHGVLVVSAGGRVSEEKYVVFEATLPEASTLSEVDQGL
jgi:hypothetical protein